ncbi:MAG: transferrin-binding protein-like solute binding protein, partial [Haemophilus parainfluenzae]|nr:transferrin-binding protein-like solute binding protein [Haemophilus parainfluenzae]
EKEQALAEKNAAVKRAETAEAELIELKSPKTDSKFGRDEITANGKVNETKTSYMHIYNLEQAGYIIESVAGRNYASYGGNPTLYKQLRKLSGDAVYKGKSSSNYRYRESIDGGPVKDRTGKNLSYFDVTINVNFTQKRINGNMDLSISQNNYEPTSIILKDGSISNDVGRISFGGKTESINQDFPNSPYTGEYHGMLMGDNADQLSGTFNITRETNQNTTSKWEQFVGGFAAEKQK